MGIFSCKKDSFNYPDGTVGISKITYFPILTLKGDRVMLLVKGTAFTDPGVTATEAGAAIPATASGQVNINTPGVYDISYSATNKDGYPASISRKVVVYDTKADAAANNFSGKYARDTNGAISNWTKLGPGVYSVSNPGGADATFSVIVFNDSGNHVFIPSQLASDDVATSSANEVPYNTNRYSWVIKRANYGPALRTFVKQ